jgi:hypothetical protein
MPAIAMRFHKFDFIQQKVRKGPSPC